MAARMGESNSVRTIRESPGSAGPLKESWLHWKWGGRPVDMNLSRGWMPMTSHFPVEYQLNWKR